MTSKVTYLGDLRIKCRHIRSGSEIITDAPVDNQGKGESFSPTDTVATALASCMMTIMGIKARDLNFKLEGTSATVTKTMAADPRRISKIEISFDVPVSCDQRTREILERSAKTCPVMYSIHPDIEVETSFQYP
ncbi:MAG TPA: OsmC family protein [Salinimicrobium sp.]|nr:OsmC family protein [Salinimicrobium sp.]